MKRVVDKAFACVTCGSRLLVFRQPESPGAGIQVPAGTVESGERPEAAVLREAREESGLDGLVLREPLGVAEFDMSAFGRAEIQRRHFFHLEAASGRAETWRHLEVHGSDGKGPHVFEFFWVELPHGVPRLIAGHDAFVEALVKRMDLATPASR